MLYKNHMDATRPVLIRILLMPEGDFWVAQALEFDIAAQGRSEEAARIAFLKTLSAQIALDLQNHRQPLEGIKPAPAWYFEAYEQAQELDTFLRVPPAYIAQAISDQHIDG